MLRESVFRTIQEYEMIRPGDRVLVGFSGGADSLCLLVTLSELSEKLSCTVSALHVHHGLRGAGADADAEFCREFCERNGIPFTLCRVDTKARASSFGESHEEAARHLRYDALFSEAERTGAARIAVAHHQNDSAETFLFNLVRGSGLRGLSGIPPVRGKIIRPLLFVSKHEIFQELSARGLSFREDETNDSDDPSRNLIRHYALPALSSVRRDAVSRIAGTAAYISEVEAYLTEEARERLRSRPAEDPRGISAALLRESPGILREYLAAVYLRDRGFSLKDFTREHFRKIGDLAALGVGKSLDLPQGIRAEKTYDSVIFYRKNGENGDPALTQALPELRMKLLSPTEIRLFPEKEYTKCFDYDKINESPVLRTRRPGDRIAVAPGQHKKLSDWMTDEKIPKAERGRVLLVADGSEILWVVGYRMGADAKVTKETIRVLEISIFGEEQRK